MRSRRNNGEVTANGGFATTRKARRGKRRSAALACTTTTDACAKRLRNAWARPGWSSTATTRAPAATSGAVIAPVPAPMSSTNSPGRMPAEATRRCAASLVSRCHPQPDRGLAAGTTHHHHRHQRSIPDAIDESERISPSPGRVRFDPDRRASTKQGGAGIIRSCSKTLRSRRSSVSPREPKPSSRPALRTALETRGSTDAPPLHVATHGPEGGGRGRERRDLLVVRHDPAGYRALSAPGTAARFARRRLWRRAEPRDDCRPGSESNGSGSV